MRKVLLGALLLVLARPAGLAAADPEPAVVALVQQLGHPVYAERRDARRRLLSRGLAAFDALHEGVESSDPEVADACRALLNEIIVDWAWLGDPPTVRGILESYRQTPLEIRGEAIQQLIGLPLSEGVPAVARIARFESSEAISRDAAAELLVVRTRAEPGRSSAIASAVNELVAAHGVGRRPAALWLALAAAEHTGQTSPHHALSAWRGHALTERLTLEQGRGTTTLSVAATLHERWLRAALIADQGESAVEATQALTALTQDADDRGVFRAVGLAIDTGSHDACQRLFDAYGGQLTGKLGRYLQAEFAAVQGRSEEAERLAQQALAAEPEADLLGAWYGPRHVAASHLYQRGQFDWACQEYRASFEGKDPLNGEAAISRWRLSYLLSDAGRHAEAVETLKPLVEAARANVGAYRTLPSVQNDRLPASQQLFSRFYLSAGLAARESGDVEAEMRALRKAVSADGSDADIVIAMYQVGDPSPSFAAETQRQMERLRRELESSVWRQAPLAASDDAPRSRGGGVFALEPSRSGESRSSRQADAFNQWAWLVSNTEGDFEKALRYSRASLRLAPDTAGYLDTLGRCLFSAGDLEEAVRVQRRAVQLEPRMQVMQRQLAEFEAALARNPGAVE